MNTTVGPMKVVCRRASVRSGAAVLAGLLVAVSSSSALAVNPNAVVVPPSVAPPGSVVRNALTFVGPQVTLNTNALSQNYPPSNNGLGVQSINVSMGNAMVGWAAGGTGVSMSPGSWITFTGQVPAGNYAVTYNFGFTSPNTSVSISTMPPGSAPGTVLGTCVLTGAASSAPANTPPPNPPPCTIIVTAAMIHAGFYMSFVSTGYGGGTATFGNVQFQQVTAPWLH